MAAFRYKAIDTDGRKSVGRIDALNIADLEMRLSKMGMDLIHCRELGDNAWSAAGRKFSRQELIAFTYHLEQLLRSGVPILEGLADLRDSVDNPAFRKIVSGLIESIEGGQVLSQGMEQFPQVFDNVYISLVRAGEESGRLDEVLKNITESLKWQDDVARQTRRAVFYPAFVSVFVVAAIIFVMTYLVPKLAGFITNMGHELPFYTRWLISLSGWISEYWYALLALPLLLIAAIRHLAQTRPLVRYRIDDLKLKFWLFGPILKKIILARFANYTALLYASGITVLDSLKINEAIAGNAVMSEAIRRMRREIADGNGIGDAAQSVSLFPPLVLRMIRIGESTGDLDGALENVSYFYDREIKDAIERMQAMLGPVLTVVLAAMIAWVAFSVFWPLYDVIVEVSR